MRLRLIALCLYLLMVLPISAQPPSERYAVLYLFNPNPDAHSVRAGDDSLTIAPFATSVLYVDEGTPVFADDATSPLDYTFFADEHYLLTFVQPSELTNFEAVQVVGITAGGELVSDAAQSIWWVGNFFPGNVVMRVVANGVTVIDNLTAGGWNYFSAPFEYFRIAFYADDEELFATDGGFGEPYYTGVIAFTGTPNRAQMRVLSTDIIHTDLFTWLEALSELQIIPYTYGEFTSWVARAGARSAFDASDRVIMLPYDVAFFSLSPTDQARLMEDDAYLNRVLANHIAIRSQLPQDPLAPIITLNKTELPVMRDRNGLQIGDAGYITRVFLPNKSEVWLIDAVLLPSEE